MTDKQITIDGVDVSECEHVFARTSLFKEKNFVECTAFFLENEDSRCNCSDNPNCYYKQLKRKEQECERLKQTLAEIKKIAETQQSWNEWNRQFSETESEDDIFAYNWSALKQILQVIKECEEK